MRPIVLILFPCVALGWQAPPSEEKPDPRTKARQLLDSAVNLVTAAQPQVHAVALMHLADAYQALDREKSAELFRQAFATATALPPEHSESQRASLQTMILRLMAQVEPGEALTLLKQVPDRSMDPPNDPRIDVVSAIVRSLVEQSKLDAAIEAIETMGAMGVFSQPAASLVLTKLPADDPRRGAIFSSAMTAYKIRPDSSLPSILASRWDEIPRALADPALTTVVNQIMDRKEEAEHRTQCIATGKGTVSFASRAEMELFDVMHLVQASDPGRAAQILAKYPALASAVQQFPKGTKSMSDGGPMAIFTVVGDDKQGVERLTRRFQTQALMQSQAYAALRAVEKDPEKAVQLGRGIPMPDRQAQVLASIARSVGEKDPVRARGLIGEAVKLLDDVKDPDQRMEPWQTLIEAAHRAKDDNLVQTLLGRALADAQALYKLDVESEKEGAPLREYWPSTQAWRRLIRAVTKAQGVEAEFLLARINDADLNLLARIEMAETLLDRPEPPLRRSFAPRRKK